MVFRLRFSAKLEILDAKTVFCVAKAALLQMINNQSAKEIYSRKQQYESISNRGSIDNHSGKGVGISSTLDVSDKSFGTDSILFTVELNAEKVIVPSIVGESIQNSSTSILDKLFSSGI
ncbi:hypothetical protein G4B88_011900, partial [Cannabis sativa]